jgi:hypothetical protein
MALKVVNTESLDAVADAINEAAGKSGKLLFPDEYISTAKSLSAGGGEDLSTVLAEQEELVAELKGLLALKAKLGDAKLPSVIDGTVTELTAEDLAGVTRIRSYAFYYNESLASISLPNGVTSIGSNSFNSCKNLVRVTLPKTIETIGANAFYSCTKLAYIDLTDYGESAPFPSLTSTNVFISAYNLYIIVPKGRADELAAMTNWASYASKIVEEGEMAYTLQGDGTYYVSGRGAVTDTDIVIPNSYKGVAVTGIADNAFQKDGTVTSLTISDGIVYAGKYAFESCPNIVKITVPASLTTLGQYALRSNTYKEATAPAALLYNNYIGVANTSIEVLTVVNGSIPTNFNAATKLHTLKLLKGVTNLAAGAFQYADKLKIVDLTDYGADSPFPTLGDANVFEYRASGCEFRVPSGRKTELSAIANWSRYAKYIVEV